MTAYLDSSVVLRRLLGQPRALPEWRQLRRCVSSRLTEVECLRTLDRLRLERAIDELTLTRLREATHHVLGATEIVEITRTVLSRAAQPSPTALGTLDAIHMASVQMWSERRRETLVVATHDVALATAARAHGFRVAGV
jgi:hypothetical protein